MSDQAFFVLFFVLLGLAPALVSFLAIRQRLGMSNARPSRCGSAGPGFLRLTGRAVAVDQPVQAPHTGEPCVWYRLETTRPRTGVTVTLGRNRHRSDMVDAVYVSTSPFFIEDETGRVLIERDSLEVETPNRQSGFHVRGPFDLSERLTGEFLIRPGDTITAVGELVVDQEPVSKRVAEILKRWKQDPTTMRRFDTNQDGQVDVKEWEAARTAARDQAMESLGKEPPRRVLAKPRDGRPFMVSTLSIEGLHATLTRRAWVFGALGSLAWAVALWVWRRPW